MLRFPYFSVHFGLDFVSMVAHRLIAGAGKPDKSWAASGLASTTDAPAALEKHRLRNGCLRVIFDESATCWLMFGMQTDVRLIELTASLKGYFRDLMVPD